MPEPPTPSLCHSVMPTLKTQMPAGCSVAYIPVWRRQATALPVTSLQSSVRFSSPPIQYFHCGDLLWAALIFLSHPPVPPRSARFGLFFLCLHSIRGEPQGRRFPSLALHSRPEPLSDSLATSWILFSLGFWHFPF